MEEWKDVVGYEGYYKVSSLGNILSLDRFYTDTRGVRRKVKGKLKALSINKYGYVETGLSKNNTQKTLRVHRLVCEAFHPNPDSKPHVNHIDGNPENNHKDNLEWCTAQENLLHAIRLGLFTPNGEDSSTSKLTNDQVLEICTLLDTTSLSQTEIGNRFGVHKDTISYIHTGKSWNWLTNRKSGRTVFDQKGKNHPMAKSVRNCRGEIFDTAKEAASAYNLLKGSNIGLVCKGIRPYSGKYSDGTPIKWEYVN